VRGERVTLAGTAGTVVSWGCTLLHCSAALRCVTECWFLELGFRFRNQIWFLVARIFPTFKKRRFLMCQRKHEVVGAVVAGLFVQLDCFSQAVDYAIQRVAAGLAQPTFVTQAPGDPANIIYYSTRIQNGGAGGFNPVNNMGGIFRYDMNTRTSTQILDLSSR